MAAEGEEITISELLATIWQGRLTVAVVTFLCIVLAGIATWLPAPVYEAYSTLLFPAGRGSQLFSIVQSLGISVPEGANTSLKMFRAVLESDRMRQRISRQAGISPKELRQATSMEDDAQASLITVSVKHRDRQLAQRIAKLYVSELRTLNRELNLPLARNHAEFLKQELTSRTSQLRKAENELLQFLKKMVSEGGAPSPSAVASPSIPSPLIQGRLAGTASTSLDTTYLNQLNATLLQLGQVRQQIAVARARAKELAINALSLPLDIPPAAQWREKLTNLEYELRVAELTYGPEAPSVVRLRKQIDIAKQQLRKEIDNYLRAIDMNLDPNLAQLELQHLGLEAQANALQKLAARAPEDTLKLQRLSREVATLSELVQQLRTALEQARIEISRDPSRWEVLEEGTLKEEPVNKRWKLNIALGLMTGLIVGGLWVLTRSRRS